MLHKSTVNFTVIIVILLGLSLVLYANTALANVSEETPTSYQIGEAWSRIFFDNTFTNDNILNRIIHATAKIVIPEAETSGMRAQQGTAFYLGKFNGEHLMMTNYHVMSGSTQCRNFRSGNRIQAKIYFETGNRKIFPCLRIIATFENLEATFFTISVPNSEESRFQNLALKFDFKRTYNPGDKLLTAGYGSFNNPHARLTYENSETCMLISNTSEPHWVLFEDQKAHKIFHSWSFSHSCEISPGDSGSPLVSRLTGKVIGLNWATNTSKAVSLQNSATVRNIMLSQDPSMWTDLSYGVPNLSILAAIQVKNDPILNEFINSNLEDSLVDNLQ